MIATIRKIIGNSEGEGVSKANILKESMKLKWNFQGGGGGLKSKTALIHLIS